MFVDSSDGEGTGGGRMATARQVEVRGGCFCNPGACAMALGLTHEELLRSVEVGHTCWDDNDLLDGRPTGALRASFGYMSTLADLEALLVVIVDFYVKPAWDALADEHAYCPASLDHGAGALGGRGLPEPGSVQGTAVPAEESGRGVLKTAGDGLVGTSGHEEHSGGGTPGTGGGVMAGTARCNDRGALERSGDSASEAPRPAGDSPSRHPILSGIFVYPIKSCAAFAPPHGAWPLGPNGLLFDREWMLVDAAGKALTQKRAPRLTQLRAAIDLRAGRLTVTAPAARGVEPLSLLLFAGGDPSPSGEAAKLRRPGAEAAGGSPQQDRQCGCRPQEALPDQSSEFESDARSMAWFSKVLGVRCQLIRQRAWQRAVGS
ncbi:Molybdenum cofactor sulfurase, partial [Cymbomonas tetramitiformis]